MTNKEAGELGEKIAAKYLAQKGYKILEQNYRFGHGEIDIIAGKDEFLVFVEVKTRTNLEFGEPEYAITKSKQNQVRKIAAGYLYEKEIKDQDCRLDVIAILLYTKDKYTLNHIENAF